MLKYLMLTLMMVFMLSIHPSIPSEVSPGNKAMVLLYHHFVTEEPTNPWELNRDDFAGQMQYLAQEGYRTLSLEEFYHYHQQGAFPPQSLLLTFDDAYYSFYTMAYPILQEYSLKAVLFPIVEFIPGLKMGETFSRYVSFSEMREMQESGLIDYGSHSYGLHHFRNHEIPLVEPYEGEDTEAYRQRILVDLRVSRDLLSLQLGEEIESLAWPYGLSTPLAQEVALEVGYSMLFSGHPGLVTPRTPLTCIPRYSVTSGSLEEFIRLLRRL